MGKPDHLYGLLTRPVRSVVGVATMLEANRETRQVVVTVDGQLVAMWDGFASATGMVQFAESLLRTSVGVKGRHILKSVAALERAREAAAHPESHPREVALVADLRGMRRDPEGGVKVSWSRVD